MRIQRIAAGRRGRLLPLVVTLFAFVLTACGGVSPDADVTASESPTDAPIATEDAGEPTSEASSPPAPVELQEVLVAIPAPSLNFLPYMIATDRELGFYEDAGVDLTVEVIRGDAALAGLLEGSIHFTAAGGTAMRAAFNDAPFRAVMMTVGQTTFSVMAKAEIASVADLAGRTVGLVGSGLADTTGVALTAVLESEGLDPEQDVDIFVAPTPPDILAALIGGSVDAAVLAPPQSAVAEGEGFTQLARAWEHVDLTQGQIATTLQLIEGDPELVKNFLRGSLEAIQYIVDNPDETLNYIVERFELDEDVARASYEIMREAYLADGRPSDEAALGELPPGATLEDLQRTVDWRLLEEVNAER